MQCMCVGVSLINQTPFMQASYIPRLLPVFLWCTEKNQGAWWNSSRVRHQVEGTWRSARIDVWEKRDGNTPELSKLESPGIDVLTQAMTTFRMLGFKWCALCAKFLPSDVMYMMNFTSLPHFSVCIIEKLGGAWVWMRLPFLHHWM